jgi:glycosyltransferase involved in cell wall biosynthesis
MKGRPLISIGMPVYNCAPTLPLAIRSLQAQTWTNWELILIDDGSSDGTEQLIEQVADARIRVYVDGRRRGLAVWLNQAIALSRGLFFARMDGDDVSYPRRFEKQVAYLEAYPQVDLVGAQVLLFGSDGGVLGKPALLEDHQAICARAFLDVLPMRHPTFLGHMAWFRKHRYDDEAIKTQDQILLLRSYRDSFFANVPEILLGYREEQLNLQKMLRTRQIFLRFALRELLRRGEPLLALRVILRQMAKTVVEIAAVQSGLNYRLLKHRLGPLGAAERREWEQLWHMLHT